MWSESISAQSAVCNWADEMEHLPHLVATGCYCGLITFGPSGWYINYILNTTDMFKPPLCIGAACLYRHWSFVLFSWGKKNGHLIFMWLLFRQRKNIKKKFTVSQSYSNHPPHRWTVPTEVNNNATVNYLTEIVTLLALSGQHNLCFSDP